MTEQLRPCPFCGGEARIFYPDCTFPSVGCRKCGTVSSRYVYMQEAIDAWNRRKEETHS
ncbi:MAG: Lar family restriction alleviation protein [Synergistaceae bacterium]|nr:Lar family restriction alleviation protein [Synergistaceae bacterium]